MAVAMSRTRDQSSHTFLCLKMNLPAKGMVRGEGAHGEQDWTWDPTHSLKLWKSLRMMMAK